MTPTWTDADISEHQSEFAANLRIPFLNNWNPSWYYITGIVIGEAPNSGGIVPTDAEVATLSTHLQVYLERCYNASFREQMKRKAPYDITSGANFGFYMKRPDGGWRWRKRTWQQGPIWEPAPDDPPQTLEDILTRATNGPLL